MADSKDFIAGVDSNAKKSPRRIVFITRRTSAQVKAETEDQVQTFPEVLFRAAVAVMSLAIVLVWIALMFNAPLEGFADPSHTPNPAKAPWYFLGLQEMLHYFPPVVAGVLVPGLVVMALIVIPYFKVNIEADGLFLKDRQRRLRIFYVVASALSLFPASLQGLCGAGAHADHGGNHAAGGAEFSAIAFGLPTISGGEAAFLLGDDLVFIRTGGAHRHRYIFPRTGLGLGLAVAGFITMLINIHKDAALMKEKLTSLWQKFFGDSVRAFGVVSLVFLGSLAIAPAKNFFSEWRHYQHGYLRMIRNRSDAITLRRHFQAGIQQIWLPELGVVDRCTSCHVGLKEASLADVPTQPFRTHPAIPHKLDSSDAQFAIADKARPRRFPRRTTARWRGNSRFFPRNISSPPAASATAARCPVRRN